MNYCNNLPLYLYNEMSASEKEIFEKHLDSCKECKESVKIFQAVSENKKVYNAPPQTINAILEKTSRKTPFFTFAKTIGFALAAAACVLIAVFTVPSHMRNQTQNFSYADYSIEEMMSIDSDLDELENDFLFYGIM